MSWWSETKNILKAVVVVVTGYQEPIKITLAKEEQESILKQLSDSFELLSGKPGDIIPCDNPMTAVVIPLPLKSIPRKIKTGYEWMEWSHGRKGVPWRINTEEFNALLLDGWEIVDICDSFTLLKRPTFVQYLDYTKPRPRRRKK
jgi:hypothetical protein